MSPSENDVEMIEKYWKPLTGMVFVAVAWGVNTQQIATAQSVNDKQDVALHEVAKEIKEIKKDQASLNGIIGRNTDAIKHLAEKISESTQANKEMLRFLLQGKRD